MESRHHDDAGARPRAPVPGSWNLRTAAALALVGGLGLLCVSAVPAWGDGADVDATRAALEKWVETQRVLSKERQDWKLGKEMLQSRVEVVQREIDSTLARTDDAKKSIADADGKRAGLIDENERLKQAAQSLGGIVAGLEARTTALLARLPDPIRERVKPLSQRLPAKPDETKLSLSERFQNIVGILNEVNKFQGEISVASEVRTLADGRTAEVTALYLGIGQGWYASGDGKAAGVGAPTPQGWAWTPDDASGAAVKQAVAVLKNEQVAAYVRLPVRVD